MKLIDFLRIDAPADEEDLRGEVEEKVQEIRALEPEARALFCANARIKWPRGEAPPSLESLAARFNSSVKQIRNAVKRVSSQE